MRWPWDRRPDEGKERRRNDALRLMSKRLKECEDALRRNPDDVDALFTKGVFLARIGEYSRALQCLDRVTDLNPDYPGIWHLKSSLYLRVGDRGTARKCLERAQAD